MTKHVYKLVSGNWEPTTGRPYTRATCETCEWSDTAASSTPATRSRIHASAIQHCKTANQEPTP